MTSKVYSGWSVFNEYNLLLTVYCFADELMDLFGNSLTLWCITKLHLQTTYEISAWQ